VMVKVKNRGTIPPDLLPVIFDPLRIGTNRHARSRGLGLGLFITQQIAAAHGGSVGVESNEASGTTFSLRLPRKPPGPDAKPTSNGGVFGRVVLPQERS
jgi:signal transduction histidine kinase